MKVFLWQISRDSVGVSLRRIHVDLVFVRLCSCVHGLDPSDLRGLSMTTSWMSITTRFARLR